MTDGKERLLIIQRYPLTVDFDILLQIEVFNGATESMDVQFALEVPDKAFGVEHVGRELGKTSSIGHGEATGQVKITMATTECK